MGGARKAGSPSAAIVPAASVPATIFVLALIVLALAVRLAFTISHQAPLVSDSREYDQLAWNLARTGHYEIDGSPTAYRPPGYPAFIASIYALVGHHPTAALVAQAMLDSLTAVLLYDILRRRNRGAAMAAGIAWAIFPAAVLFSSTLLSESLLTFGLVLFTWLVARDRVRTDWAAGALLGALLLIKPMLMLVFAAFIPLALVKRPSARPATRILAVAIIPVIAWMLRNLLVIGSPVLTTSVGVNLLVGNNAHATGGYMAVAAADADAPTGSERDDDRAAGRRAFAAIAANPVHAFMTAVRKVAYLASSDAELAAGTFGRAEDGARMRDRYRSVPGWLRSVVNTPTAVALLLGILGLATSADAIEERVFHALLGATIISCVVFFGSSRFRFPLMPFLILFGSAFALEARERLRRASRLRIVMAWGVCLLLTAVWFGEALVLAQGAVAAP